MRTSRFGYSRRFSASETTSAASSNPDIGGDGNFHVIFLIDPARPAAFEAVDVMRALKRALDPHDLMNPGKVLPG